MFWALVLVFQKQLLSNAIYVVESLKLKSPRDFGVNPRDTRVGEGWEKDTVNLYGLWI